MGLNSSGDRVLCWEKKLGVMWSWSLGESGVGTKVRLEVELIVEGKYYH